MKEITDSATFRRKLSEQTVFDLLKDDLKTRTKARLKYWLKEHNYENKVNIRDVYTRIVNYRIKKYGSSVCDIEYTHKEFMNYQLNDYNNKIRNRYRQYWEE